MNFWNNLSVKTKLIGAFGLLILMIVAISAAALGSIKQDGDQFADYVQGVEARAAMANQVRLAVDRRAIAARNLVLVTKAEDAAVEKAAVLAAVEDVRKSLDALQALSNKAGVPSEVRSRVEEIARIEGQYSAVAEAIVGLALAGDREAAIGRMNERCRPLLAALVKATDDYIRFTAETSSRLIAETDQVHGQRIAVLAAACAAVVVLSLLAALAITRSIVKPLQTAVTLINDVAEGNLDTEVQVQTRDEFGHLLQAIAAMQGGLRELVTSVRHGADSLSLASAEIAQGNHSLSSRTETQASALQQTASSMEQLSVTVRQNADNASQANRLAEAASTVAPAGRPGRGPGRGHDAGHQRIQQAHRRHHLRHRRHRLPDQHLGAERRRGSRTGRRTGAAASRWSPARCGRWPSAAARRPRRSGSSSPTASAASRWASRRSARPAARCRKSSPASAA